jgi:hypothetical protein
MLGENFQRDAKYLRLKDIWSVSSLPSLVRAVSGTSEIFRFNEPILCTKVKKKRIVYKTIYLTISFKHLPLPEKK